MLLLSPTITPSGEKKPTQGYLAARRTQPWEFSWSILCKTSARPVFSATCHAPWRAPMQSLLPESGPRVAPPRYPPLAGRLDVLWCFSSSEVSNNWRFPIGSMYAIYGNIYHQYIPNIQMLAYIPAPWILWVYSWENPRWINHSSNMFGNGKSPSATILEVQINLFKGNWSN